MNGFKLLRMVSIWLLLVATVGAVAPQGPNRRLQISIGTYDPDGSSESSRNRPSRQPDDHRYVFPLCAL